MAVVKADAYGHGTLNTAWALASINCKDFAVTTLQEGIVLRSGGIDGNILVLDMPSASNAHLIAANDLTVTVCNSEYATMLNTCAAMQGVKVKVHIKVDSGMNRFGFSSANDIFALKNCKALQIEGIFTHFANSQDKNSEFTFLQWLKFNDILQILSEQGFDYGVVHCCNSSAVVNMPQMQCDMVRCGLLLYGAHPCASDILLLPAMSLKATVVDVKKISKGMSVGYGCTYIANADQIIATTAIGYADGYPWALGNCGKMVFNGKVFRVAGRVCMDSTMLVADENTQIGDEVIVWGGGGVSVEETALLAATCPYELLCRVSSRVQRIYID